jgi:hypothetical protein
LEIEVKRKKCCKTLIITIMLKMSFTGSRHCKVKLFDQSKIKRLQL